MRTLRHATVVGVLILAALPSRAHAQAPVDSLALSASAASGDSIASSDDSTSAHRVAIHWEHPPGQGRPDLLLHASLSLALGLGVGLATEEPAAAAGAAISLGIAKEIMDPRFDKADLMADLVGAALAALITHWLDD